MSLMLRQTKPLGTFGYAWKSGAYYWHPGMRNVIAALVLTQNLPIFIEFPVLTAVTIDQIGANVQASAGGSSLRLGIYTTGAGGLPADVVVDGGLVSSASTGAVTVTVSTTLQPALYWLAIKAEGGAPSVFGVSPGYPEQGNAGQPDLALSNNVYGAYEQDPTPAAGAFTANPGIWWHPSQPGVAVRVA